MIGEEFTCDCCHQSFTKRIEEAEAIAEFESIFKEPLPEDTAIVCDECWRQIMQWANNEGLPHG